MKIQICAQWKLEALSERPFDTSTALISIGEPGSKPPTPRRPVFGSVLDTLEKRSQVGPA